MKICCDVVNKRAFRVLSFWLCFFLSASVEGHQRISPQEAKQMLVNERVSASKIK